jgi:hypothetical protein
MIFPMVDFFSCRKGIPSRFSRPPRMSRDRLLSHGIGTERQRQHDEGCGLSHSAHARETRLRHHLRACAALFHWTGFPIVCRSGPRFEPASADGASPHAALWRETGETVNLAVINRGRVLYLEIIESERGLHTTGSVGLFDALHSTALGKAIMSHLPRGETARLLAKAEMLPRTGRTIIDLEQLPAALDEVAGAGYAIDDEENEIGMRCVAAPIVNADGWPTAVSVFGPTLRMADDVLAVVRAKLLCRLRNHRNELDKPGASVSRSVGGRNARLAKRPTVDEVAVSILACIRSERSLSTMSR